MHVLVIFRFCTFLGTFKNTTSVVLAISSKNTTNKINRNTIISLFNKIKMYFKCKGFVCSNLDKILHQLSVSDRRGVSRGRPVTALHVRGRRLDQVQERLFPRGETEGFGGRGTRTFSVANMWR